MRYYTRSKEGTLAKYELVFGLGVIVEFVFMALCSIAILFRSFSFGNLLSVGMPCRNHWPSHHVAFLLTDSPLFAVGILGMAFLNTRYLDPAKRDLVKSAENSNEQAAAGKMIFMVHATMFVVTTLIALKAAL